ILPFSFHPNHFHSLAIPAHTKGRFAIVTDVGLGMRWTRVVRLTRALSCGRRSRVVLTPRRWRQVGDDASHHAGDGGKKARSPGRARRKPLKPLRREGRGRAQTVVATPAFFIDESNWSSASAGVFQPSVFLG